MEVYIDIILLENTLINIFILLITLKLVNLKYKRSLVYLAGIVGGLYTLAMFSEVKVLTSFGVKLLVALVMIYIPIEERRITNILKATGVFFLITFTLGGICFSFVFTQNTYLVSRYFTINNYSIKYLVISMMAMFIVVIRIVDYIKERAVVKNFTYDIYIDSGEKTLLIKGFLDTGNELREPVTNLPCIIVENRYLKELNIKDEDKFLINYKTIKDKGSIKGFKGKNIRIRNCESEHWTNVEAIICECDSELSKENDFQALLSRGVV